MLKTRNSQTNEMNEEQAELDDFKLRFQRSVLLFYYNEEMAKVPVYLKSSVLNLVLLERLNQILKGKS